MTITDGAIDIADVSGDGTERKTESAAITGPEVFPLSLVVEKGSLKTFTVSLGTETNRAERVTVTSNNPSVADVSSLYMVGGSGRSYTVTGVSEGDTVLNVDFSGGNYNGGNGGTINVNVTVVEKATVKFNDDASAWLFRVTKGKKLGDKMPRDPERDGYLFTGWFTEANGHGTRYTFETVIDVDTELYASWAYVDTDMVWQDPDIDFIDVIGGALLGLQQFAGADLAVEDGMLLTGIPVNVPVSALSVLPEITAINGPDGTPLGPGALIGTGAEITFTDSTTLTAVVYGDVNGNGAVELSDVNAVLSHFRGRVLLTGANLKAADINGDGQITLAVVNKILSYFRGRIGSLVGG
jgi:uncharacterized repeat protein (TIGR02543 family)